MKKIFWFLLAFILLSSPKKVNASSITASIDTINQISSSMGDATNAGFSSFGYFPVPITSEKHFDAISEKLNVQKNDLFSVSNEDININPLTSLEISNISDPIYNSLGESVDLSTIFKGEFDNGYFSSTFYCDEDGELLYSDQEHSIVMMDIKHGGNILSSNDWINAYYSLDEDLILNNYKYALNGGTIANTSFYICVGQWGYTENRPRHCWSLFVANQYDPGNTVPYNTGDWQRIYQWVTNDLSNFSYNNFISNENSQYSVTDFSSNYQGYYYRYKVTFMSGSDFTNVSVNNTFANWLNGINPDNTMFGKSGYFYDPRIASNAANTSTFKPLSFPEDYEGINVGDYFGASALDDYVGAISSQAGVYNPSYDGTVATSASNYPLIYDVTIAVPEAVTPSLPVAVDPSLTYPLDTELDASNITPYIPIISDLKNKFPFSIPWDIAAIIEGLEAERETPYINTTITIPGINYTWVIDYDLSDFDDLAGLFRTLFLIAFILGLAYFSYEHFFGS